MKVEGTGGILARRKTNSILQQAAQERINTHQEGVAEDIRTLVRFFLGGEQYAIDAKHIKSIDDQTTWRRIYPIPCVPSYLLGVINLRSEIISILDLRDYLGLPISEMDDGTRIMVVNIEKRDLQLVVGLLVDKVEDIIKVDLSDIQVALTTIEKVTAEYIEGEFLSSAIIDVETYYEDRDSEEETLIGIIDVESVLEAEMNSRLVEEKG
ncbi:TPA: hypothetical protein EYO57_01960 [Candidatus Poribacteria bacterium]|nr:hypothetical protein [Candidatus Poribacteria bacterium]HIB99837.1 hypothetical protein [Candidatus Poribacteria bacterium]HIO79695.1 hypothetical protein [Candidatus Poribacteria bacterium]